MTRKPHGILLDMGGTLLGEFRFDRAAGRARLLEIAHNPKGVTLQDYAEIAAEFYTVFWDSRDEHMLEFPVAAFWRLVDERLGLSFDIPMPEVELEFWKVAVTMRPEPGLTEALDTLRTAGIPLGVVSNSAFSGYVLASELERNGLLDRFEFLMSSADYGARKPHRAMLLTAAAKLKLDSADIWFIGDSLRHDVAGAIHAGMTAVWYNPGGAEPDGPVPHVELRHWAELSTRIGQAV